MSDLVLVGAAFLLILLALYAMGVPVAFAIGLTSAVMMALPIGPQWTIETFATRLYSGVNSYTLIAIPFFILAGRVMNSIGMTDDLFDFSEELVGPLPGGLGYVNVVVSMIFSGMSGSAVADAAGLGTIEYKAMTERGYDERIATGITGASSTIGPIIPPSIPMIIYGVLAQVSIGALFIGGIIPGFLMAIGLMVCIFVMTKMKGDSNTKSYDLKRLLRSFLVATPALVAPLVIIGGILMGLFTPTEAAVVATVYALLIGVFYYRAFSIEDFTSVLRDTFEDTIVLTVIIAFADVYGFLITISGIPGIIGDLLYQLPENPTIILLVLTAVLLVIGTFMDATATIIVTVPILAPILPELGVDLLVFGVIMMMTLMIGLITPPFGVVLFVLERVTGLSLKEIMRGVAPFYVPLIAVLVLVILFPGAILFLPRAFGLG